MLRGFEENIVRLDDWKGDRCVDKIGQILFLWVVKYYPIHKDIVKKIHQEYFFLHYDTAGEYTFFNGFISFHNMSLEVSCRNWFKTFLHKRFSEIVHKPNIDGFVYSLVYFLQYNKLRAILHYEIRTKNDELITNLQKTFGFHSTYVRFREIDFRTAMCMDDETTLNIVYKITNKLFWKIFKMHYGHVLNII